MKNSYFTNPRRYRLPALLAVACLHALFAYGQFSSVFVGTDWELNSLNRKGVKVIAFADSLPQLDTHWLEKRGNHENTPKIYCNNAGIPVISTFMYYSDCPGTTDVYTHPENKLIYKVPNYGRFALLPRDDSTFWIIDDGRFVYQTLNYRSGRVDTLDSTAFAFGVTMNEFSILPDGDGWWAVNFLIRDPEPFHYTSVRFNATGITDTVSGQLVHPSARGQWNYAHHGLPGMAAWNPVSDQLAWISGSEEMVIPDHYTETQALWQAGFNPQTGRLHSLELLRLDTTKHYDGPRSYDWQTLVTNNLVTSVAFSPSGQYRYVLEAHYYDKAHYQWARVVQHNLSTGQSVVVLPERKGGLDSTYALFNARGLYRAPNGKIYVFAGEQGARSSVYEISYPDKPGQDCSIHRCLDTYYAPTYSYSQSYYEKRVHIGQWQACTPGHRFLNAGDPRFTRLRWHFFDTDSNLLHTRHGDSIKCPPLAAGAYLVLLRGEDPKGFVNWHWDSIYYSPPVTARIAVLDSTGCEFNTLRFADSSLHAGLTDSLSWQWTFWLDNQERVRSLKQHPEVQFDREGNYTLQLVFSNGVCSDTTTQREVLSIIDGPKPGFALSDTLVCAPAQIAVADSATGLIVKRRFVWSDGFESNKSHSREFAQPQRLTVRQWLQGPNGCISQDSHSLRIRPGIAQLGRVELQNATVLHKERAQVSWQAVELGNGYHLWRWQDSTQAVQLPVAHPLVQTYLDSQLNTHRYAYRYRIHPVDSCGNEGYPSNPGTTLRLRATNINNRAVVLSWNAYESWPAGVKEYIIEASEEGGNWQPLHATGQRTFQDDRTTRPNGDTVRYRIKAVEQGRAGQVSVSNEVTVPLVTTFFVPNAFTPNNDGINDVFKVGHFGLKTFSCTILARNGQVVHYSTDPDLVWDGTLQGTAVAVGAYKYLISATDELGEEMKINGTVTVVR